MPEMTTARASCAIAWIPDGRLFAVGGRVEREQPTATVEMLDCPWETEEPAQTKWRSVASLNHPRKRFGLAYVAGILVAAGGQNTTSIECFNLPSTAFPDGQWTEIRPMSKKSNLLGLLPLGGKLVGVGTLLNISHLN